MALVIGGEDVAAAWHHQLRGEETSERACRGIPRKNACCTVFERVYLACWTVSLLPPIADFGMTGPTRWADESRKPAIGIKRKSTCIRKASSTRNLRNEFLRSCGFALCYKESRVFFTEAQHCKEGNDEMRSPPLCSTQKRQTARPYAIVPFVPFLALFHGQQVQLNTFWGKCNDGIAADAKLGYQVPRLWFPHARPGQAGAHTEERAPASAGVSMPEPRPRPSGGADLPIGSDAVVQEYQQMQAFRAYRSGHDSVFSG